MKKIIIFGTGKIGQRTAKILDEKYSIIEFWNNNEEKQGTILMGIPIMKPSVQNICQIDKFFICSVFYDEIFNQLTEELKIPKQKISNHLYHEKNCILQKYKNSEEKEIKEITDYLETHNLHVLTIVLERNIVI